jgi:ABC-type lipoprotein release transport system permease subunit
MSPILFRAWAEMRSRWRSWAALAVFLGIFGGAVMAISAGARRTDSAYERFLVSSRAWDVQVPKFPAIFAPAFAQPDLDRVERLPQVAEAMRFTVFQPFNAPVEDAVTSADPRFLTSFNIPKVLSGRLPKPDHPHEVALNFAMAQSNHLRVGSRIRWTFLDANSEPSNPVLVPVDFTVVGIEAAPGEFPPTLGNEPAVLLSRSFLSRYLGKILSFESSIIRLKHGAADVPAFGREVQRMSGGKVVFLFRQIDQARNIDRSFHLQAIALWLLAGVTGLVTVLVFSQTLARQTYLESVEYPTLRSLGMTSGDLVTIAMIRAAVVAVAGSLIAAVVAALASPLFPRGLARIAEPNPGFAIDLTVLAIGTFAILGMTALLQLVPALRGARSIGVGQAVDAMRTRNRPSFADRLARAGMPPSGVAGVRLALEPGRGRSAVPVWSSIVGVTVGLSALIAAITFGTSLDRLLHTPRLYGVTWDLDLVGEFGTRQAEQRILPVVRRDPRVAGAVAGGISVPMEVDGFRADAVAIAGDSAPVFPALLEGRRPVKPDEIVVGAKTLQRLGKQVGDPVRVDVVGTRPGMMRIVGVAVIPPVGDIGRFGEGALVPYSALFRLVPGAPPPSDVLVRLKSGADEAAFIRSMRARLGPQLEIDRPQEPSDLVNFGRVQDMPLVLAGLLGLLAAATLGHMLITMVLRRRRDLAVLKTLGFVRRQMSATVAWQASTLAAVALLIGLPLGIAVGRWTWSAFAHQFGILPESVMSISTLLLVVPATLLLSNLLAAVPGRMAARTQPAVVLRSE